MLWWWSLRTVHSLIFQNNLNWWNGYLIWMNFHQNHFSMIHTSNSLLRKKSEQQFKIGFHESVNREGRNWNNVKKIRNNSLLWYIYVAIYVQTIPQITFAPYQYVRLNPYRDNEFFYFHLNPCKLFRISVSAQFRQCGYLNEFSL